MKNNIIFLTISIALFLHTLPASSYILKQAFVFSRHGLRTPIGGDFLQKITPKPWPIWKEPPGYLTAKGYDLEKYMGAYFVDWFRREGLLTEECPNEELYVHANSFERTKSTAKAFLEGGFEDCNDTVHFRLLNVSDPLYNVYILNASETFRKTAVKAMEENLMRFNLTETSILLDKLLDYRNSQLCVLDKQCSLLHDKTTFDAIVNAVPTVEGPLKVLNLAADAMLLAHYEGLKYFATEHIKTDEDWLTIREANNVFHEVIFNTEFIVRHTSKNLMSIIKQILLESKTNITMMFGHDTNVIQMKRMMNFKPYKLKKQYEKAPIGGKIVFQKWYDEVKNLDLLRIDYVYQSTEQLRYKQKLDSQNPPLSQMLELSECEVNAEGYCPWSEFEKILYKL